MKRSENRKSWRDLEELYSDKSEKVLKAKKKRGRRRTPRDVQVVENEEDLIRARNEILKGRGDQSDSLEARARRVWSIGKLVGLKSKGVEEAAVNRLMIQLSKQ